MNSYDCLILYVIKFITLYKSHEVNWLKNGDVVRGTWLDHLFFTFPRIPGASYT